jgi:hypothetical protein
VSSSWNLKVEKCYEGYRKKQKRGDKSCKSKLKEYRWKKGEKK